MSTQPTKKIPPWLYAAIFSPIVLLFFPPLYNVYQPTLMGIPFFFWFQACCIILAAIATALIYFASR